ncbi:MAG: hypothetical protein M1831_001254 [Alyxoria varia]|nr:MAG: hypothetical protein M1831_001254 [Alyxoria varia]
MSLQQLEEPPSYSPSSRKSTELPLPSAGDVLQRSSNSTLSPAPNPSIPRSPGASSNDALSSPLSLPSVPKHPPGTAFRARSSSRTASEDASPTEKARSSSVSMANPAEELAAKALCDIGRSERRNPEPSALHARNLDHQNDLNFVSKFDNDAVAGQSHEPKPMLSLITSKHDWLAGSVSAYTTTKSYTPQIFQLGAGVVESALGSVAGVTGVESKFRNYLEERDEETQAKRRRISSPPDKSADVEIGLNLDGHGLGRKNGSVSSVETLPTYEEPPAYHDARSPSSRHTEQMPPLNRSWSTQLVISTSGLGAALSTASLQSLKTCLRFLKQAIARVRYLMEQLKQLLEEYVRSPPHERTHTQIYPAEKNPNGVSGKRDSTSTSKSPIAEGDAMDVDQPTTGSQASTGHQSSATGQEDQQKRQPPYRTIADRIRALSHDIWNVVKSVPVTVSSYTGGGALPENAGAVVRWQLTSVPKRWHRAKEGARRASTADAEAGPVDGGDREDGTMFWGRSMVRFAVEALDMMQQVSGVVQGTIESAEVWLERMGHGNGNEQGSEQEKKPLMENEQGEADAENGGKGQQYTDDEK